LVERTELNVPVLRHIKTNVGPTGHPLIYELVPSEACCTDAGEPVATSRAEWRGLYEPASIVQAILKTSKKQKACAYLIDTLKYGPRSAREVCRGAESIGIGKKTLETAKKGVAESVRQGDGWMWQLCPEAKCEAA
jgi:hypothetical protein